MIKTKLSVLALVLSASIGIIASGHGDHSDKKPEIGTFGIDLSARDLSVKPGDDFFMYASGTWYKNFELPSDKSRYGAFNELADKSSEQVKTIIDDLAEKGGEPGSSEQMIADFYRAYMDTEQLNKLGLKPLQPYLDKINAIESVADLTEFLGKSWYYGSNSPITTYLGTNRKDPNKYQVTVGSGGLGLPSRDYYLEDNDRFKEILSAYQKNIADILAFTGARNTEEQAANVLALETQIAQYTWPRAKLRNRDLTLNQISRAELSNLYSGFDWDTYLALTGYKAPDLNMSTPDAINAAINLINTADIEHWKSYLTYHLISNHAGYLSEDIYNTNFEFAGKVLGGQQEPEPRWKRAISAMSGTSSLGFAIGQVYVKKFFPESSKQQMAELVENLRKALSERVANLDWMGEETKVNAQAKLKAFRPKIGYPDVWPDLSGIVIKDDALIANVMGMREFFRQESIERQDQPTDRERWGMTPQRVNAYYNSAFNEIVFPAAILQAPFFDPNADPAVNYGAIGAVIGHEMGHGFDDQGSKSDANGIQRNWWTDEDRKAFEARTRMLVDQYSKYEPIPGNFVNGNVSLGENIGDVGGLAMAYHAYKLSLNGKEAPIIDGTTGDQRFFLSWAQVWREMRTEESMLNQLRRGPHSPPRYRTLAPRNHDAWYEAFDVQPGDELYLPPEQRVRIW
jgi:predicted metalloendopeptidase